MSEREVERLNLHVAPGTADKMSKLAGGERRRGEWLSSLVGALDDRQIEATANDLDTLKLAFIGLVSAQKMLDLRLGKVEQQLAALIAREAGNLP